MKRASWAWLLALGLTLSLTVVASAEGPGTGGRRVMLDDHAAGPYLLRVVTSPTPPRAENLYVEVRVLDAEDREPITDANVVASAEYQDGQLPVLREVATHDIAPIPHEYAAHLLVPEPGVWKVTISVDGVQGTAEVDFLIRVAGSAAIGTALAVGLPVAGLALLILVFLLLQRNEDQEDFARGQDEAAAGTAAEAGTRLEQDLK